MLNDIYRQIKFYKSLEISETKLKKIILICLVNSLSLWFITIAQTHIYKFLPDTQYYARQLSIFFWIGISLCMITLILILIKAYIINRMIYIYHFLIILLFIIYIYGTPIFIYTNPRIIDVYAYTYYAIGTIVAEEHTSAPLSLWFHEYIVEFPGSGVLFSIIIKVLGIASISLAKYYPLYLITFLSFLIYAMSKKVSSQFALLGPITYISLTFIQEYNLAPQSHALMLGASFFLMIISLITSNSINTANKKVIIIFLWISILIAHPTTPIIILLSFIIIILICIDLNLILTKKLIKLDLPRDLLTRIKDIHIKFTILYFIIYISYIIYIANFITNRIVSLSQKIVSDLINGDMFLVTSPLITNPLESYMILYYARFIELFSMMILGSLIVLILLFKAKFKISNFVIYLLFISYILISVLFALASKFLSSYGPDRGIIFALIPFSILIPMILDTKFKATRLNYIKFALIIYILLLLIVSPFTIFGSDPYNFVSESELSGMNFILKYPELGIDYQDLFVSDLGHSPYLNYWRNLHELKQQKGYEYANSFLNQTQIYDGNLIKIHKGGTFH